MRYVFEDCELDTDRLELRRAGRAVALEPQVFDVLAYLVRHHERAVPRDELIEHIWPDRYISEAALNSRLMAARKAVGDSGREQRLIRTIHGRGYRFVGTVVAGDAAAGAAPAVPPGFDGAPGAIQPYPGVVIPLAGRAAEVAVLEDAYRRALSGQRSVVLIVGEPGIGKTTLVRAFIDSIGRHGGPAVAEGLCLEHFGAGEAFSAFLDALDRLARSEVGASVMATLRRRAPSWMAHLPWLVPPEEHEGAREAAVGANRDRMLREIVEAIDAMSLERPLVVVLEDLHWADPSTVDALVALARRPDHARLLVIGTSRPDELVLGEHPFAVASRELVLRGLCREIRPTPFDADAIGTYLRDRFGVDEVPGDLVVALDGLCNGNPLFLAQLVDEWTTGLRVRVVQGELQWDARAAQETPGSLQELVRLRIARLSADERAVLAAAAVAGTEFSAAEAAFALERDEADVEMVCDGLAARGVFVRRGPPVVWPDGAISAGYSFTHQLCQEVLNTSHGHAARARLHGRVGEGLAIRTEGDAPAHASRLAHHFSEGGAPVRAIRYRQVAAEHAAGRGGYREAADHLRAALRLIPQARGDDRWRRQAEMAVRAALGTALMVTNGFRDPEVETSFRRVFDLALELGDEAARRGSVINLSALFEFQGKHREAEALVEQLTAPASVPTEASVPLRNLHSCAAFHRGAFETCVEQADLGLALPEPETPDERWAVMGEDPRNGLREWSAQSLWFMGRVDSAARRVEEAVAAADRPGRRYALASALSHAARIFQLRREPARCEAYAEATVSLAREHGFAYDEAVGLVLLGWARGLTGDGAALDTLRAGIEQHRSTGATMDRPYFLGLMAEAALALGDPAAATVALDAALSEMPAEGFFYAAELHRLRAALLLSGDPPGVAEAEAALARGLALAREQGAGAMQLRVALSLATLRAREHPDEVRELLEPLVSSLTEGATAADVAEARALLGSVALQG